MTRISSGEIAPGGTGADIAFCARLFSLLLARVDCSLLMLTEGRWAEKEKIKTKIRQVERVKVSARTELEIKIHSISTLLTPLCSDFPINAKNICFRYLENSIDEILVVIKL